jgi:hypothetical protein
MDAKFTKYGAEDAFHEAGFDSLLTARIMIHLSARLALAQASSDAPGGAPGRLVMPSFESGFWKEYGNRLRVFGTHEAFMELDLMRP